MRIEIIADSNKSMSINGFQSDFAALMNQSNFVLSSLHSLRQFVMVMNGGVGKLTDAVTQLEIRMDRESEKQVKLEQMQTKCEDFINLVRQVDCMVADAVSRNQNEFYYVNEWARPSISTKIRTKMKIQTCKVLDWIKKSANEAGDEFSHYWSIFNETDFRWKSKEELKEYYNDMISKLDSGNMTNDDQIRLKAFMNYLGSTKINSDMSATRKTKIKLYNSLYEKMHPYEKIESDDECYKYLMYNTTASKSFSLVVADTIKSGEVTCGNCKYMENLTKDGGYGSHGNFNLYDFHSNTNDDGSVSVKFNLSTMKKTTTEITVFDADGNVYGERQYLVGQRDPSNPLGVVQENIKQTKDLFKGKFFSVDADGFNSKNTFDVKIPPGGCIRVTDDPALMNSDPIANSYKEQAYTIAGMATDKIAGNIKSGGGTIAYSTGKSLADTLMKDVIYNTNSSATDYADGVSNSSIDTAIGTACDVFKKSGGVTNPGVAGYKAIDLIVKANSGLEGIAVRSQEKHADGNGAVIIYP